MFYDIKDQMDSLNVLQIMAYSEYESSIERAKQKAAEFHRHESWQLYGWIENGEIVGVCGFEVHKDYVEILNIAVAQSVRHHGVGDKMITALWKKYEMTIEAETDDDAVDFYRKRGFQATAIQKYGIRRWTCVLAAPKPLDQVTDEERARLFPVILSDYNPAWPQWFTEEKENLLRLIGANNIARISHYGSTSIPGLLAKPTVDILLEINDDTDIDKLITSLPYPEYICLNPPTAPSEPPHLMFLKGYTPTGFANKVYHIHVRYPSDWDELHFRDYLIVYPETAAEYATLKAKLHKDFEYNRDGYTDAKSAFIRAVTEKAWKETALERMMENNHWVEEILKDRNLALIGFADLSEIDTEIRYGYQYGICIAIALKVFPSATNEPSKEYYDEYKNVSARLREASDFLAEKIKECGFNASMIVSKGLAWDTSILPGFVAIDDDNNLCGMVTYRFESDECEITTLNSLKEKQGIGTGLINAVISKAKDNNCRRLWLITTNDNTHAIRFYQRFGFTLQEVHINALEKSRKLKPSIPLIGMDNIPLQHEFEFEIIL